MAAKVGVSNSRYKDALEQTSAYNARLGFERKQRSPFLDSQTGVAQVSCHLWKSKLSRRAPAYPYQICSYPGRRWKRKPREQPVERESEPVEEETTQVTVASTNGMAVSQLVAPTMEASISNVEENAESAEVEAIEESEEESEEESDPDDEQNMMRGGRFGRSSKKGLNTSGIPNYKLMKVDPNTLKIKNYTKEELAKMTHEERQKPYICEICGKRYKNGPGLKYHYTHYNHDQDGSSSETTEVNPQGSPMVESNLQPSVTTTTVAVTKESHLGIANPNDYCDFCLGDATKNRKTLMSEELLSCADCGRCGHPSCLQFTEKLTAKVKQYRWQCIECKSCTFCGTSDNDHEVDKCNRSPEKLARFLISQSCREAKHDQLLFCDDCDRGYHMYCLKPPMDTPPEGSWICKFCEEDEMVSTI